jgi:hypothetical protein
MGGTNMVQNSRAPCAKSTVSRPRGGRGTTHPAKALDMGVVSILETSHKAKFCSSIVKLHCDVLSVSTLLIPTTTYLDWHHCCIAELHFVHCGIFWQPDHELGPQTIVAVLGL